MASKQKKKEVDAEVDLHGMTAEQMRVTLQKYWPEWRGLHRVRIIHGQGTVLKPEIERWCREMGLPCAPDPGNPGALRIFPQDRSLPTAPMGTSLREAGLRLSPEQEAYLRDPETIERARQAERKRREEEERRLRADEEAHRAQKRRDEDLWLSEMARLDSMERKRGVTPSGTKPIPPRIVPRSEMKFQEGYWRAELVRVADTDTDTLKKEKRTGLDKLAPPMPERKPEVRETGRPGGPPPRDTGADQALFEAELARLTDEGQRTKN